MVCPGCDLLLANITDTEAQSSFCPRCGILLHKNKHNSVQKALALSLTGLLLYLPSNFLPLISFGILGTDTSASIYQATLSMFAQNQYFVGLVVIFTGLFFPLCTLACLFLVTLGLHCNRHYKWMPRLFRGYLHLSEWAMTDVFLVGILITIIKMSHSASIDFGVGFYCFLGLVFTSICAQAVVDKKMFWSRLDRQSRGHQLAFDATITENAALILCHSCRKIYPVTNSIPSPPHCSRCGESLHKRKDNSIARTWALIITAIILTFPANLLPIMEVEYFGAPDRSTIMDGIIYFFKDGSYGVGLVIFTASILVPLFKIIGLILILLSIHFRWKSWLRHKAVMFRCIQFIGRWSMLDIFVISLLCALVQFGFLSTINVAPAALYFTGVVLSTMFAAISFDPRLLWDAAKHS